MNSANSIRGEIRDYSRPRILVPSMFIAAVIVANLTALWFAVYKILPLTLFVMGLLLFAAFRPAATVSLRRLIPGVWALIAVYLYTGLASSWAPNPEAARGEFLLVLLAITPALFFGYFFGSRFTAEEIGLAFGCVPLIFTLQALYNKYVGGDAMLIGEFSIRSLLGGITCWITPLLLGSYLRRCRVIAGITFLLSFLLAIFIQSRSSIIIVLPVLLCVIFRYSRRTFVVALFLGFLLSFVFVTLNVGQVKERFTTENTKLDISDAVLDEAIKPAEERVDFDRRMAAFVSTQLFAENPWLGAGYTSVFQTNEGVYGLEVVSHGFLPGTAGELGLVGLGLILIFFYQLYLMGRYVNANVASASTSLISISFWYGLAALVMYGFFHQTFESAIFGIAVGVAFGLTATAPNAQLDRRKS